VGRGTFNFLLLKKDLSGGRETFTLSFIKLFRVCPAFTEPVNLGSCGAALFIVWFIATAIASGSPQNIRAAAQLPRLWVLILSC
jgi:hypothetical protein